jgi:hypothetical protein
MYNNRSRPQAKSQRFSHKMISDKIIMQQNNFYLIVVEKAYYSSNFLHYSECFAS